MVTPAAATVIRTCAELDCIGEPPSETPIVSAAVPALVGVPPSEQLFSERPLGKDPLSGNEVAPRVNAGVRTPVTVQPSTPVVDSVGELASDACTVAIPVPLFVGVPATAHPFSVTPAGSAPAMTAHRYGAAPPVTVSGPL